MRAWPRRVMMVFLGMTAVAALLWLLLPAPIPVDVAMVERGALQVTVDEQGQTRVRDRYVIAAPVTGRLRRVEFDVGDAVDAGQALARLDPPPTTLLDARTHLQAVWQVAAAEAAVQRAQAQLERVAAERDFAEQDYQRSRRLIETEVITQRELDQAESTYRALERQWEAVRFEKQVAEHQLAQARVVVTVGGGELEAEGAAQTALTLRAPTAGRVLRVVQESEAVVAAGAPVVEVGDPGRLEVVADLLSQDAARVEVGAAVHLERWGGPALRGRVRRVEPAGFTDVSALGVEEQRVNVIIDLLDPVESYAPLGDGYRVEVRIVTWEADDVLRVPTGALFRDGEAWTVFRIEAGRAVRQEVEIGRQTPLLAEVRAGLAEGDRVVLYPGDRVEAGVRVTRRE